MGLKSISTDKGNIIDNPWVIKCYFDTTTGMGKIVKEHKGAANVLYSEGQLYTPETWDVKYLKRFASFKDMVKEWAKINSITFDQAYEEALRSFPSQKD